MMEIEKVQALKVTNKNAAIDVLYNIGMFFWLNLIKVEMYLSPHKITSSEMVKPVSNHSTVQFCHLIMIYS